MTPLLAFLLYTAVGARSPEIVLRHDGDYGPYGGDGPSFSLIVTAAGRAQLGSHEWIVQDGEYEGVVLPADLDLLYNAVEDLKRATPAPAPLWMCPHAPAFWVEELLPANPGAQPFITNVCISAVQTSLLAPLFDLASAVVGRTTWTTFRPSAPGRISVTPSVDPSSLRKLPVGQGLPWK